MTGVRLDPAKALLVLRRDGAALAAAARRDLAAAVPGCPGWTVRDVLRHTGEVYAHKTVILRGLLDAPPAGAAPEPGERADPVGWYEQQLAALRAALRAHPPQTPVWSWHPPERTVGFWIRRMAQETVIHRADVESAFGPPPHVDATVAVDGIDELLAVFAVRRPPPVTAERSVAVQTAGAGWTLRLDPEAARVEPGTQPRVDARVAGTPSRVLYWLWGRLGDDAVDLRGDPQTLAELRRTLAAATG